MSSINPFIEQFQVRAELLTIQGSLDGLDEALAALAAWMKLSSGRLTEVDKTELITIGGMLYREGLRRHRGTSAS